MRNFLIAVAVLVALGLGGFFLLADRGEDGPLSGAAITSTTQAIVSAAGFTTDGDITASGDIGPGLQPIETIAADDTLVAADSMKVIYAGTAGVDLTLPTAADAAGVVYRVIVSANFATTNMTITGPASGASDDTIYGSLEVAGAVVLCSAEDTITFVASAELPGDWVELRSNGTNWHLTGQAGTSGGITCTDAD